MPSNSKLVQRTVEAMSIRFNNMVYELKSRGERVIVLSLGEAFFDIPLYPMDDLPEEKIFHYSHSRGIPELRERIARYYSQRYGVPTDPASELIITAGSKAAIYMALLSTVDPGDEVVVQEPCWVSYPEQIRLCGATPVQMPYNTGTKDYERFITERTKVVIVNNPHNPRGEVLSQADVKYLVDLARERDLYVLSDEAYSDFLVGEGFFSAGRFDPEKKHTIICNSLSKNYGMSGWRLGYVITNPELTYQILKVNQHLITCPATILEYYLAKHFDEILEVTLPQIKHTVSRRNELGRYMDEIGLRHLPGTATFYYFVSIAPSRLGSVEFCTRLLQEGHVSTVPGLGYGESCDSFIRVSVGTESMEDMKLGLRKVKELVDATA